MHRRVRLWGLTLLVIALVLGPTTLQAAPSARNSTAPSAPIGVEPAAGPAPAQVAGGPIGAHWFWNFETADGTNNRGLHNSLILVNGYPWAAYYDYLGYQDLIYGYKDASGWHAEVADNVGNSPGQYTSVGVDATGLPVISYYESTAGDLRYAYKVDARLLGKSEPNVLLWVHDTVDSTGDVGQGTALKMYAGSPRIAYYDRTNGNLKYATKSGATWTLTVVDSSANDVGRWPSMDLGASGYPQVSYLDDTADDLKYAYQDGLGWHIQIVDSAGQVGFYTSLVVDAANYPHISYYDATNTALKYAYKDGSGWHFETVDSAGDVGKYSSLKLDAAGNPYISYQEYVDSNQYSLKYAYKDARGWHSETVDGGTGYNRAGNSSLVLGSNGFPQIAYASQNLSTSDFDLKYAAACLRVDYEHPATECLNTGVTFTNYTIGQGTLGYEWSFGDGVTSTLPAPTHAYTAPGIYTVALTATNTCGTDVLTSTITISGTPDASFTWGPVPACVGAPVQFTNTSVISAPASFQWNFDDGFFSVLENPSHTFTLAGTYDVSVFAMNNCGIDYATNPVTVHAGPIGTFGWTPTPPVVNEPVTFNAAATSTLPVAFAWDLGDGTTGEGPVVNHTYASAGFYTVTLTTTSACGQQVTVQTVEVCGPVAGTDFSWLPLAPIRGDIITFTGVASGSSPISFTWAFGDGQVGAGQVLTHTYSVGGLYTATVTTTNACGQESQAHPIAVCGPLEQTDFTWLPADPAEGEVVTFMAATSGTEPIAYAWTFGDGVTATGAVVTHTFVAGDYQVQVVASNSCSQDSAQHTLHVCDPTSGASFTWTPEIPLIDEVVTFTAGAQGDPPITFTWTFGDGQVGAGQVVTHSYAAGGTYAVIMLAENPCGQETVEHGVHVCLPAQGLNFSWLPTDLVAGQVATFTAQVSGGDPPIAYEWDFGDGQVGAGQVAAHTYAAGGSYTVTVTAINVCGEAEVAQIVIVCETPTGTTFSYQPSDPVAGETVTFTAAATGTAPLDFAWDFGDGGAGSGLTVTHVYAAGGPYTATVTTTNACGMDQAAQVLAVCAPPDQVSFTYEPLHPGPNELVTFTAQVAGGYPTATVAWTFGDGGEAQGLVVTHSFWPTDTYTVQAVATTPCGFVSTTQELTIAFCVPPTDLTFTVTPNPPFAGQPATYQAVLSEGSEPLTFNWIWGDGTAPGTGPVVQHTYAAAGTKTVVVSVFNGCGSDQEMVQLQVQVPSWKVYLPVVLKSFYRGDSYEPDDSATLAKPISLGVAQVHDFFPAGDVDWVYLTLQAGTPYYFSSANLQGGADTWFRLFQQGSYGTPVAENDECAGGPTGTSCIAFTPATSGRYELEILNYPGAPYAPEARYTVEVTQQ